MNVSVARGRSAFWLGVGGRGTGLGVRLRGCFRGPHSECKHAALRAHFGEKRLCAGVRKHTHRLAEGCHPLGLTIKLPCQGNLEQGRCSGSTFCQTPDLGRVLQRVLLQYHEMAWQAVGKLCGVILTWSVVKHHVPCSPFSFWRWSR